MKKWIQLNKLHEVYPLQITSHSILIYTLTMTILEISHIQKGTKFHWWKTYQRKTKKSRNNVIKWPIRDFGSPRQVLSELNTQPG